MTVPLLEVSGLVTRVFDRKRFANACDGVDFTLHRGQRLGLAGESGSGKTLTALSIMRLLSGPQVVAGRILFEGTDLLSLPESRMREYRGRRMAMIFQEPGASLNPTFTIGNQLIETLRTLKAVGSERYRERAMELLEAVRIPDAASRLDEYPGSLSGGMQQRAMLALALAGEPDLLIADEPTTALDVTVQAQVLSLIREIVEQQNMAVLMITHDFGVIAETCDEVAVLYAGRIVEAGEVEAVFADPLHPYTHGLLDSVRSLDSSDREAEGLKAVPGSVPELFDLPAGCAFQNRCPQVMDICRRQAPETTVIDRRRVRCHRVRS